MAENKNTFVFYTEWKQDFEFLTDEEAGKLIKHLLQYVNDENPSLDNEDRLLQFASNKIKSVLKKDLKKYEEVVSKRSEAGKKGGINSGKSRTYKQNKANEANASNPKQNERDNEYDNVYDNDILLEKESKYVDDAREEKLISNNLFGKEEAKSLLKSKQISLDRWCINSGLDKDQVLQKVEEFVDKKTDWEENDWKSEGDLVKNFEFWLQKNANVVVNNYKYWTKKQFFVKVEELKPAVKNKIICQEFFNHYSMPGENGKMRFQNMDAWDTREMLKKWINNQKFT